MHRCNWEREMDTRVVTIINGCEDTACAASLIAENLATELAYSGRTVLLADAATEKRSTGWARARAQARVRPRVPAAPVQCEGGRDYLEHAYQRFDHIVIDAGAAPPRATLCALIAAQVAVVVLGPDSNAADRIPTLAGRLYEARLFNPALRVLCVGLCRATAPDLPNPAHFRACAARFGPAAMASTSLQLSALRTGSEIAGQCSRDLEGSAGAGQISSLWHEISPLPTTAIHGADGGFFQSVRRLQRQFFKQKEAR